MEHKTREYEDEPAEAIWMNYLDELGLLDWCKDGLNADQLDLLNLTMKRLDECVNNGHPGVDADRLETWADQGGFHAPIDWLESQRGLVEVVRGNKELRQMAELIVTLVEKAINA